MSISEYKQFLESKRIGDKPSGFTPSSINSDLFDFQQVIVRWACQRGRAAVFADTGMGKTAMQCEWARLVHEHTGGNVMILAPLCVAQQTVNEARRFGISVHYCRDPSDTKPGITITNYEMAARFDPRQFVGVVLDESSILKHQTSKTRALLTDMFCQTPYRLSCTATPSPNDHMELGNQAEFLGVMSAAEMLAMFFTHDGGETSKWRLKGHGKHRFWEWMSTWAICIRNPSDLGFDGSRFILPDLRLHEHVIDAKFIPDGQLFATVAQTLTERRQAKRQSISDRVAKVAEMVNESDDQWIIWCHLNDESSALAKAIPDSVEVHGSLNLHEKESRIMAFTDGKARVLVTKPSIAGFGMNWQHCHKMAFAGLDDSFESYYQAIRREWRFGQKKPVDVHLFVAESEGAVRANLERKQRQAEDMAGNMVAHMRGLTTKQIKGATMEKTEYEEDVDSGAGWTLHLGDCVEVMNRLQPDSIDYAIFSPPFASLYTYSNSDRDMGNCKNHDEFYDHFRFVIDELTHCIKPGRLVSFHCMNLPTSKFRDGVIGITDFRGNLLRMFTDAGWIFHSEVCIWKDPVTAMQRTKALGLLYKQVKKDTAMSRQGIPDYLVTVRKPGQNNEPVTKTPDEFPVSVWQRYASPVWMDINPSKTLQYRQARENDDERHICPLQLEVIERGIELWTNPGDTVLSPYAGIGSEGFMALQLGRKFIGSELKRSYWDLARKNLSVALQDQGNLFADVDSQ